jgi:hypothetical protein
LLLIAWVLASIVRAVIPEFSKLPDRFATGGASRGTKQVSLTKTIATSTAYCCFACRADALGLALLTPVQEGQHALNYLPNILLPV